MSTVDWPALTAAAVRVMHRAYAPYSKFPVGAAGLVGDGRIVVWCNVENAAYGVTLCAECGMVSDLIATGGGRLVAMSCVDANSEPLLPCGRCRQLLWEHGGPAMLVNSKHGPMSMAVLLPHGFGLSDLEAVRESGAASAAERESDAASAPDWESDGASAAERESDAASAAQRASSAPPAAAKRNGRALRARGGARGEL